jgi:molybdopterin-guanine dinucleotide biosynthesis protein A
VRFAAVVLAGGRGSRLGGVDKPAIEVGGVSLLDRALAAVAGADPVVVVGPRRPVAVDVVWAREEPAGAGPVPALLAGLDRLADEDLAVVLLAADLPLVSTDTVARLLGALGETGAVLVDDDGRPQWLTSAWRLSALRGLDRTSTSLRGALPRGWVAVPAVGQESADVDSPADLDRFVQ